MMSYPRSTMSPQHSDRRDAFVAADSWDIIKSNTRVSAEARSSKGSSRRASLTDSRDALSVSTNTDRENASLRECLAFDMDQPWQRSLLRELENIEGSMQDQRRRPQADRVLLGHAESGDYALECEDDLTVFTDASSTVMHPGRQVVHRHLCSRQALFQDDDDEDVTESNFQRRSSLTLSPRAVDEAHYRGASVSSFGTEDWDDIMLGGSKIRDVGGNTKREPITPQLPMHHTRACDSASALSPKPQPKPSALHGIQRSHAFSDEFSVYGSSRKMTVVTADSDDPAIFTSYTADADDGGCICMGYDILEMFVPSSPRPKFRHKKRRTSCEGTSLYRVDEMLENTTGLFLPQHA